MADYLQVVNHNRKEKPMAEEPKKGQKPTSSLENVNVAQGLEKPTESTSEVTGHMSEGRIYICWNCGARNIVSYGTVYFMCWNCGAVNVC